MSQESLFQTDMVRSAVISNCGAYRYCLERNWMFGEPPKLMNWVMVNPSTADGKEDDQTIRKCCGFAERAGFNGIVVTNLFALRSTDVKAVWQHPDPVGPMNDSHIRAAAKRCGMTVCGWGAKPNARKRAAAVLAILRECGVKPHCLRMTKDGFPEHPQMLSYDLVPVPMEV